MDLVSWLREILGLILGSEIMISLSPYKEVVGWYLKVVHNCFLPHRYKLSANSKTYAFQKASLNKLRIRR